jgi:hypothetical protein
MTSVTVPKAFDPLATIAEDMICRGPPGRRLVLQKPWSCEGAKAVVMVVE